MNKTLRWLALLTLTTIAIYFLWPYFLETQVPDSGFAPLGSQVVHAQVTSILEEGTIRFSSHRGNLATFELTKAS